MKHSNWAKYVEKKKRSSLLCPNVGDEEKKFCNTDARRFGAATLSSQSQGSNLINI
jgi:hypothetical protein